MKKMQPDRELSIFEAEAVDQYFRMGRAVIAHEKAIEGLPKGYISRKKVGQGEYSYLQWRDGSKVRSVYVKQEDVPDLQKKIALRKAKEQSVRRLRKSMRDIERFVGKEALDRYEEEQRSHIEHY